MIRTLLAAAAVAAFAAAPAQAAKTDCIGKYDTFWQKMQQNGNAKPATEDVVATQRMALRAFDACEAGDEANFANFWQDLQRYGNSKDDSAKFWTELQRNGNAKK
jgi:hypothetical protein